MKITLESNPSDAPCCINIIADNGQSRLIQTDWDYPSVANSFGFSLRSVQKCDKCGKVSTNLTNQVVRYCRNCQENTRSVCYHSKTDGTVDCPDCGCSASAFIQSAREWIDDNDGAQAEDPGYFEVTA